MNEGRNIEAEYEAWVLTRPPRIQEVARRFKPWRPYRIKSTGQLCSLYSFGEPVDTTQPVTIKVIAQNAFGPDHVVFGLSPDDLEEVDDVDPVLGHA